MSGNTTELFRSLGSRGAKPNPDAFWSDKWGWMDDASPADLVAAVAGLDGAFRIEPVEPVVWFVDGQVTHSIMPGRYLVVPLEADKEPS